MCAALCNNTGLSFLGDFQIPQEKKRSWGCPKRSWGFCKKKLGILFVYEPQNLNLEFALKEVGEFQNDCATVRCLGNWVCSEKSTENQ